MLGSVASALVLLWLSACEKPAEAPPPAPLPAIPHVDAGAFEPLVAQQVGQARRALAEAPDDAERNGALGKVLHAYDWLGDAEACYRRAAALAPDDYRWWYYLGRIEVASGRPADGARSVEKALERKPDYLPGLLFLGELALGEGRDADAERWLAEARRRDPRFLHALAGLAQMELRRGNADQCLRFSGEALAVEPRFGRALYQAALAHRARGEKDLAEALLEQHAASHQTLTPADPLLDEVQALRRDSDDLFRRANERFKEGSHAEAMDLYGQAMKRNPRLTVAEYNIGLAEQGLGRDAEAIPHYEAFLREKPQALDAINNLGLCHFNLGRHEEAVAAFRRAIAVDPTYAKAHYNLGLALERQGKLEEAIASFRAVIGTRPDHAEAQLNTALLLRRLGNARDATQHLLEALRARPDLDTAHAEILRQFPATSAGVSARRAAAFLKANRLHEAAVHALRRAMAADPEDWRSAVALGWLLATCSEARYRDPAGAVRLLEDACRSGAGGDARALDALAAAYAAAGQLKAAVGAASRALEALRRDPESPDRQQLETQISARLARYRTGEPYFEE